MAKNINNMTDEQLFNLVKRINKAYNEFDFDKYEHLIEIHTKNSREYNWLEDLCTDHRHLLTWTDDIVEAWEMC